MQIQFNFCHILLKAAAVVMSLIWKSNSNVKSSQEALCITIRVPNSASKTLSEQITREEALSNVLIQYNTQADQRSHTDHQEQNFPDKISRNDFLERMKQLKHCRRKPVPQI